MSPTSESFYLTLNAITNYGVTINNMEGKFLFVNDYFCDIVGFSDEELLQTDFMAVTYPDDVQPNMNLDVLLREGSIPFYQMKKRYIRKDGDIIHVLLQVGIIRGNPDVYVAMVIEIGDVVHDMAEEMEVNSALSQAMNALPEPLRYLMSSYQYINKYKEKNQRKSRHLANIVHELRTPLNAIAGFSNRLNRICKDSEQKNIQTAAKYISDGCKVLHRLIVDIIDFEQIESGTFSLNIETIDIQQPIQDTVNLLCPFAEEHSLTLTFESEEDEVFIEGDKNRLSFVFNNLISNAIKYTEKGSVQVKLYRKSSEENDYVCVSVTDSGIGIEEKDFDAIFDEYKKIHRSINKGVDSIGLGLPIAKKITEMHKGKIEVASKAGQGSTFTVTFPCVVQKSC